MIINTILFLRWKKHPRDVSCVGRESSEIVSMCMSTEGLKTAFFVGAGLIGNILPGLRSDFE